MQFLKIILPVILVAFLGWWFLAGRGPQHGGPEMGAPPVTVSAPKKAHITEWDEYTGRFRAAEHVDIRARVSGYLEEIRFKDGQVVAKGDVLFIIDQRPFKIALDRAQAAFDLAEKDLNRTRDLRKTGNISQQDLDRRTQEYRAAKTALDDARLHMEFTEVKAPIAGRMGRTLIDAGNLVIGGDVNATLLTTIVSQNPIHFYFEASEQQLLKYIRLDHDGARISSRKEGRDVWVKLQDEKEFLHKGHMDFVDNEVDRSTGSIQGRAIFDNPDDVLLPGLFGRLKIAGSGAYDALLIPDEATATNQSQKIVFILDKDNVVTPHPVELGPLHEGQWRIVRSGLGPDDKIIWSGLAKIRPGMHVTPQPLDASPGGGGVLIPAAAPKEKADDAHGQEDKK